MSTMSSSPTQLRIAIIGSGMAGLTAAWMLTANTCHKVTLFESQEHVGLGAHSVAVTETSSSDIVVDVPPRIFVADYYTELITLYKHVGIAFDTSTAAGSYSFLGGSTFFRFVNFLVSNRSFPMLWGWSSLSWMSIRILWDIIRFKRNAYADLAGGRLNNLTLGEYLSMEGYSVEFVDHFLVPSYAVVCTCSCASVKLYPAVIIVEFVLAMMLNGSGAKRVSKGIQDVVRLLGQHVQDVRCGVKVDKILKGNNGKLTVTVQGSNSSHVYDHVIVATQANQAARMLNGILSPERLHSLTSIPYETKEVVLHSDSSLMPKQIEDWSPMNIFVGTKCNTGEAMCTSWQNTIQDIDSNSNLFQTWNPLRAIDPNKFISSASFERPIVTLKSARAIDILWNSQGEDGIWLCGAYSIKGIPLLEGACQSGLNVAEAISGVQRPWKSCKRDVISSTYSLSFSAVHLLTAVVATGLVILWRS